MSTIVQSIEKMLTREETRPAIIHKVDGGWQKKSWQDYYSDIEQTGAGLKRLGIQPGDRVAIMANTCYEWGLCDLATLGIQAITVPIYQNNLPTDVAFILNDSEARMLILENRKMLKVWTSIKEHCPSVQSVLIMNGNAEEDSLSIDDLRRLGGDELATNSAIFRSACARATPDDIATIIYTSGTTGNPKGVVLTHAQIMSEVSEVIPSCGVNSGETSLCFLPFAHVMGRVELWSHAHIGFTIAYAEGIDRLRNNLKEIAPTFIVGVPRIFEKIYAGILAQVSEKGLKATLFNWARLTGRQWSDGMQGHRSITLALKIKYFIARKLVLNKVASAFGGKLKFAICGGAPLNREIASFFHSAGILVLEGYGLSETTAAVAVNTPEHFRFGTVGRPSGDVQIKIAGDGEILVKSAKVMKEYYKNLRATDDAIKDGWFHTGDIGEFDESGCLRITDRKKDLIKTAGGKYVAPQKIEGLLQNYPLIGHSIIHGDQRKYIIALITIDRQYAETWARGQNITYAQWLDLVSHSSLKQLVQMAIEQINRDLASWESIKKFHILPCEFSVEGGELTPSLKVKRKALEKRFTSEIEALY